MDAELGGWAHPGTRVHHDTHGSRLAFEHLLPGVAEAGIAKGHHQAIGSGAEVWELRPLPSERQRTEHGSAGHQLSGMHLGIQKAQQLMATGPDRSATVRP